MLLVYYGGNRITTGKPAVETEVGDSFIACRETDSNYGRSERQQEVSGTSLDHLAIWSGLVS